MGIEYFADYAARKGVPLSVGISTSLMQLGSIDNIVSRVKEYVLKGKNSNTPLTFFVNNVAPHTSAENIFCTLSAVRIYGNPDSTDSTPFVMPEIVKFEDFLKSKMAANTAGYTFRWLSKSGYSHLD
jgi:hypothetical protein